MLGFSALYIVQVINKTPFFEKGGLLARLIQVLDTTDGLVKLTRFARYIANYSSEIRLNLGAFCHTDERLYSVSTGKYITICCTNRHIRWTNFNERRTGHTLSEKV